MVVFIFNLGRTVALIRRPLAAAAEVSNAAAVEAFRRQDDPAPDERHEARQCKLHTGTLRLRMKDSAASRLGQVSMRTGLHSRANHLSPKFTEPMLPTGFLRFIE